MIILFGPVQVKNTVRPLITLFFPEASREVCCRKHIFRIANLTVKVLFESLAEIGCICCPFVEQFVSILWLLLYW
uniref:Uncharacterized protein n=1 Tax=Physcomitrium patens TaxID=3218 RepID=A0A7I3Z7J2_PHYPA